MQAPDRPAAPVGILLCAGRGSRFDPEGVNNKLLQVLPSGLSVVAASARHLLAVLPVVIAVVREEGAVARELAALGCRVTVCPQAECGMAASLKHGIVHSLPHAQSWIIALGDMPFVRPSTIGALHEALCDGAAIAAPVCRGRRGNPVAFSAVHREALLALAGDQGARGILQANPVSEVAVDDEGIHRDIDTPKDIAT